MSKTILNDHLWTEEEVAYQLARDLRSEVAANRETYGPNGPRDGQDDSPETDDDEQLSLSQDVYDHVVGLNQEDLIKELEALGASTKGDEQDLKTRLAKRLQAKKDADSNS